MVRVFVYKKAPRMARSRKCLLRCVFSVRGGLLSWSKKHTHAIGTVRLRDERSSFLNASALHVDLANVHHHAQKLDMFRFVFDKFEQLLEDLCIIFVIGKARTCWLCSSFLFSVRVLNQMLAERIDRNTVHLFKLNTSFVATHFGPLKKEQKTPPMRAVPIFPKRI